MIPAFWYRLPVRWRPEILRQGLNWFPAYRSTGARLVSVSPDYRRVVVRLPLRRRTRNGAGTLFGGALYAATDPIYVMMLSALLGYEYIVWDKAAGIRFRRPGRSAVEAECIIAADELARIRRQLAASGSCECHFRTAFRDATGDVCAEIEKTIYVASKAHYRAKVQSGT